MKKTLLALAFSSLLSPWLAHACSCPSDSLDIPKLSCEASQVFMGKVLTIGALIPTTDYTFSNLPAGLTAIVTATSATTATVTLTGNATAHNNTDDVANFIIAFQDAAFCVRTAANTNLSVESDFLIDFAALPTGRPSEAQTFTSRDLELEELMMMESPDYLERLSAENMC